MTTLRKKKRSSYTVIDNSCINDTNLDWESRGLLCYLLSKPDGWVINSQYLATQSPSSISRIQRILRDLEQAGYIRRYREKDDKGRFIWISEITESLDLWEPVTGISITGISISGKSINGDSSNGKCASIVINESIITELVKPLPTLSSTDTDPCGGRDCFSSDSSLSDRLPSVCDALDTVESEVNPPPIGNPSLASPTDRLSYSPTNPSGSQSSAPRRTTEIKQSSNPAGERYDRRQANRDRAKRESIYEQGLKRKRWQDETDFGKFKKYLATWAENRRKDSEKNPNGELYGDGYIQAILSRTATAESEESKELECWRNWNIEKRAYAPVIEFEPKPKSPYDNPNVTIEGTRKIIEYLRGMGCDVSRWENIGQAS